MVQYSYSLYTAAVTGDTDSRSDENGPPPTKKRKSNYYPMCTYILIHLYHLYVPVSHTHTTPTLTHTHILPHTHTQVDQLSLLGFDIVVLVHRDSSKSHDTPSRSRHTYRKFVTPGLAESFVESPLVYGSWKDFCSSDKTSTGHAQKSKSPRKKKGVQTNTTTTTQEGDRSHDTSGVSHDQGNVSQDSNGPNTQSQAAPTSTDLTPLWNTISSLRQQIDSMQSSLNAPPTHAYPQHMYPPATGLMNTGQSTFVPVPGGGLFNTLECP